MDDTKDLDRDDPHSPAEVTGEDLDEYFRRFKFPCEVCHANAWFAVRGPDGSEIVSFSISPSLLNDQGYNFELYPIVCLNCGNSKFMSKFMIKSEVKKMKAISTTGNPRI